MMKLFLILLVITGFVTIASAQLQVGNDDVSSWNIIIPQPEISIQDTNATTACSGSEVLFGNGSCGTIAGAGGIGDFSFTDFQASYNLNLTNIFNQTLNTTSDVTFHRIDLTNGNDGSEVLLSLHNQKIDGVHALIFSDPGQDEGLQWANTINKWRVDISRQPRSNFLGANVTIPGDFWIFAANKTSESNIRLARTVLIQKGDTNASMVQFNVDTNETNIVGNFNLSGFQTLGTATQGGLSTGDINMSGDLYTTNIIGTSGQTYILNHANGRHIFTDGNVDINDDLVMDDGNRINIFTNNTNSTFDIENSAAGHHVQVNFDGSINVGTASLDTNNVGDINISGIYYGDGSKLTGISSSNPFDQTLNTTSNVNFGNITSSGNLTVTGHGDESVLLRFQMDRAWEFIQRGTGAGTSLALRSEVGDKSFSLEDSTGDNQFNFFVDGTAGKNASFSTNGSIRIGTIVASDLGLGSGSLKVDNYQILGTATQDGLSAGDLNMSGNLYVETDAFIRDDLRVTDDAFFDGQVMIGTASSGGLSAGDLNMSGNLYVNGDSFLKDTFIVGTRIDGNEITFNSADSFIQSADSITLRKNEGNETQVNIFGYLNITNFTTIGSATTGGLSAGDLNISGSYYGDGSKLTGVPSSNPFDQDLNTTSNVEFGNLTVNGNLSVDEYIYHNGNAGNYIQFGTDIVTVSEQTRFSNDIFVDDSIYLGAEGTTGIVSARANTGTNVAGGSLQLVGGRSTGTGVGGDIQFFVSPAGSSGSSANPLVQALHIEGNGYVGIGTTSPGTELDIYDSSSPELRIRTSVIDGRLSADTTNGLVLYPTTEHTLSLGSNGTKDTIVITSDRVGIGTTSPRGTVEIKAVDAKLLIGGTDSTVLTDDILGTIAFTTGDSSGTPPTNDIAATITAIAGNNHTSGNFDTEIAFSVVEDSTLNEAMRIDRVGYVGIGTSSPTAVVQVGSTDAILINPTGTAQLSTLSGNAGGLRSSSGVLTMDSAAAMGIDYNTRGLTGGRDFIIQHDGTAVFTIEGGDNIGNVGIGTTTPSERLHIVNFANVNLSNAIGSNNTLLRLKDGFEQTGNSNNFRIMTRREATSTTWLNSAYRLEKNIDDNQNARVWMEFINGGSTTDNLITFGEGGGVNNEWMRIDNGNVGIGTIAPLSGLHLNRSGDAILTLENRDNGATSGISFRRQRLAGANIQGACIGLDSDTSTNNPILFMDVDSSVACGSGFGNQQRFSINANGNAFFGNLNVGIGTESPTEALDVVGNAKITGANANLLIRAASELDFVYNKNNAGSAVMDFQSLPSDGTSSSNYRFGLTSGSTGANTITIFKPNGSSVFATISTNSVVFNEGGDDVDFRIEGVGHTSAFFVEGSSGDIGLGTTSPDDKLEVVGNFSISEGANKAQFIVNGSGLHISVT